MLRRAAAQASAHYRRVITPSASSSSPQVCFHSFRHYSTSASAPPSNSEDSDASSPSAAKISIDRSGLYNPPEHSHGGTSDSELVKHLKGIIKFRGGPITVTEYMEEVLTNPRAGFYINRDVFGAQGDFITSPEVSQMFGEGASKFKSFTDSLRIHLVECSPTLRKLQFQSLKCEASTDEQSENQTICSVIGSPVSWHATLEEVPSGCMFVNVLDDPGSADLSAYVDFAAIKHSAEEVSENVAVHGPVSQPELLGSLGINFRVEALLEKCTDAEQAECLRTGYWRLVGEGEAPFWDGEGAPIGMGTRYLAMAIVNKNQGVPLPFH